MEKEESLDEILKKMADKNQTNIPELWKSARTLLDYNYKKGDGEYSVKHGYTAYTTNLEIYIDIQAFHNKKANIEMEYLVSNIKAPRLLLSIAGSIWLSGEIQGQEFGNIDNLKSDYLGGSKLYFYPILDVEKTDKEYFVNEYAHIRSNKPTRIGIWEDAIIEEAARKGY